MIRAVLFDFDGTLADTAPDLTHALNRQLERHGKAPVELHRTRALASRGARGMLEVGFGLTPDDERYAGMRDEFLELYERELLRETALFAGIDEMLAALDARQLHWGIVTNKAARFTKPLVMQLGLAERAACVISGDSAPRAKPHPDPLLLAAQHMRFAAHQCIYVGDDLRDAQAARAAGMGFVAARYGYLGNTDPNSWSADHIIDSPIELLACLSSQSE